MSVCPRKLAEEKHWAELREYEGVKYPARHVLEARAQCDAECSGSIKTALALPGNMGNLLLRADIGHEVCPQPSLGAAEAGRVACERELAVQTEQLQTEIA